MDVSRSWKKCRFGIGVVFSLTCLWLVLRQVAWSRALIAIQSADVRLILLGSLLLVLTWGGFAVRWRVLLLNAAPVRWSEAFSYIMIGYAVNAVLPLRLGDVSRILFINRKHGVNFAFTTATLIMERLLDVLTMVVLAGLIMSVIPVPELIRHAVRAVAFTAVGTCLLLILVSRSQQRLARLESYLNGYWSCRFLGAGFGILKKLSGALKVMTEHKQIVFFGLLSLLSWMVAGLSMVCYVRAFDLQVPWFAGFLLLVIINLGSAIPSSPGFLGVFEYLFVMALSVWLVDGSVSLGVAIVIHAINLGLILGLGLIAAWWEGVKLTTLGKGLATGAY